MAQVLKRIVKSETPNVLIEDLKVFIDNVGDSIDLIGPDVTGKPMRTLEAVCRSISLDNLISLGHLTLWDENGAQLTSADASNATNLATLANGGSGGTSTTTKRGSEAIADDTDSISITFSTAYGDNIYSVVVSIRNETDAEPSIYSWGIEDKLATGFTLALSGKTDSANYILEWITIKTA